MAISRRPKPAIPHDVVVLRVALADVNPEIWRRIEIRSDATFWDLHVAIQDAIGWKDCHLHVFRVRRPGTERFDEIGIPQDDFIDRASRIAPGWDVPLLVYMNRPGDAAEYRYDLGDDWLHDVVLEGRRTPEAGEKLPRCTGGERAGPPEDCGGPDGYARLRAILADPRHREHEEMRAWLEDVHGPWAPDVFSPDRVKFTSAKRRLERLFER